MSQSSRKNTSTKQLFKVSNDLLGKSGSSPASDLPKHELPDTFANYFKNKIGELRVSIDLLSGNLDSDPFQYNSFSGPVFYADDSELHASCAPAQLGKLSDQLSACLMSKTGQFKTNFNSMRIRLRQWCLAKP